MVRFCLNVRQGFYIGDMWTSFSMNKQLKDAKKRACMAIHLVKNLVH